jgi:hypothetical protein
MERISILEGLQKAKAGNGRYLRSILRFKSSDDLVFSRGGSTKTGYGAGFGEVPLVVGSSRKV